MALKVTFENPALPHKTEVEVIGLPVFKNGLQLDITDEQEEHFLAVTGNSVQDALKDNENFKVVSAKASGGDK